MEEFWIIESLSLRHSFLTPEKLHRSLSRNMAFSDGRFRPVTTLELPSLSFITSSQRRLNFSNFEAVSKRVYSSIYWD